MALMINAIKYLSSGYDYTVLKNAAREKVKFVGYGNQAMNRSFFSKTNVIQQHALIRAGWIGSLAVYIIHLHSSNALHYYLAPTLQKLLLACVIPLIFIAVIMAWHAFLAEMKCNAGVSTLHLPGLCAVR